MIVFPMLFTATLLFIFSGTTQDIEVQQLRMNCPMPINSGNATLGVIQNFPDVNYTVTYDDDSSDYHVTIFNCVPAPVTGEPSVNTIVYTADVTNSWYDITNRASGYMFYLSQSVTAIFQKIHAFGSLIYLIVTAPAQVTGLAFFAYIQLVLFAFIGFGTFMVVRGA